MNIYEIKDIPLEVIENIKKTYSNIIFDNYKKPVTTKCITLALDYTRIIEENTSRIVLNPETLEPEIAHNVDVIESYHVRGEFNNDTADIYAVVSSGNKVKKHESK